LIEKLVIKLLSRLNYVRTLGANKENFITMADEKGIFIETNSSRSKFQSGVKNEPYEFISYDFILEGWQELINVRQATANDFKKTKGRSSFLMALFSQLPFVETSTSGKRISIQFKRFFTDDLPSEPYNNVKTFLDEVIIGKYEPTMLRTQINDKNLYRVKSGCRQDARLLGLINEFNELNTHFFYEYVNAENKDHFLKSTLINLGYFSTALICLDLLKDFSKNEKRTALEEIGMLIVFNSTGENLMLETVAKKRTHNLIMWLENTQLIDNDWSPTENYFDTLSPKEQPLVMDIRSSLLKVKKEYRDSKREGFDGHTLRDFVRNDIPLTLYLLDFIDSAKYVITGSVGQGDLDAVPWIAVMNRKITVSTQRGYYIIYLFSEDMNTVYLTLSLSVTEKTKEELQRIKEEIREFISVGGKVRMDDNIHLGNSIKAKQHSISTAAYISYHVNDMPDESILEADLQVMVNIYEHYIALKSGYQTTETINTKGFIAREKSATNLPDKELVNHIYSYIKSKGFYYQREEVINLFLSLKTKPFVILTGISGTGKTKMVQWFAESVGATEENGQFALIPIRPDWNDGSDLLGYMDIKGDFKDGPLTKVIKLAEGNADLPYFVLLDEMNLARVEYYFSDILSVMESRKWMGEQMVSSNLLTEETAGVNLKLPNNLYIIGTVNMDETTHPFSKKVLDRANTIEFNRVELGNFAFFNDLDDRKPAVIGHESFASRYLHLKDIYSKNTDLIERVTEELLKINKALQLINAHVGYRVRDEICFYMAYNEESQLMDFDKAMDHCILQKLLPRIAGSDSRVDQLLRELYLLFTKNQYEYDKDIAQLNFENVRYPHSSAKVEEMLRRLEDGFTSFWIS
jgi:hypothetical protein